VALGWLWGRNQLPINRPWGGLEVAWRGFHHWPKAHADVSAATPEDQVLPPVIVPVRQAGRRIGADIELGAVGLDHGLAAKERHGNSLHHGINNFYQ